MLLETILAALMAPVVMYVQSRGVAEVLAGKDSGWDAQQRDDGGVSWLALARGYGGLSVFGLFMGALAYAVSPSLAAWMAPVVIGMVLALSSTAIIIQTLTEKGLMRTQGGEASFSVLLVQDVAVIPILALLPFLAMPVDETWWITLGWVRQQFANNIE